jgi:hypothetical protein
LCARRLAQLLWVSGARFSADEQRKGRARVRRLTGGLAL